MNLVSECVENMILENPVHKIIFLCWRTKLGYIDFMKVPQSQTMQGYIYQQHCKNVHCKIVAIVFA